VYTRPEVMKGRVVVSLLVARKGTALRVFIVPVSKCWLRNGTEPDSREVRRQIIVCSVSRQPRAVSLQPFASCRRREPGYVWLADLARCARWTGGITIRPASRGFPVGTELRVDSRRPVALPACSKTQPSPENFPSPVLLAWHSRSLHRHCERNTDTKSWNRHCKVSSGGASSGAGDRRDPTHDGALSFEWAVNS